MTISEAFHLALQHHRAGRLADAEALYRQILAVQPNHAGALQFLGVIAHRVGRHDVAVGWIRQSIATDPANPVAHYNLGEACCALGRLDEAIAAYRRALELKPDFPEAHNELGAALGRQGRAAEGVSAFRHALDLKPDYVEALNNLGVALAELRQFDESIRACQRALQIQPDQAEAWSNLGIAFQGQGRLDECVGAYRRALQITPNCVRSLNNLGNALKDQGRLDEAVASYQQALQITPDFPDALNNLGNALRDRGQFDQAIAALRRALEIKPGYPDALNNLGNILRDIGQLDQAIAAYRQAIAVNPNFSEAHCNLGNALDDKGQFNESVAAYRQAIVLTPDDPRPHFGISFALLAQGDFLRGWEEYDWRMKGADFPHRDFTQPLWDGRPLEGRTLLLHDEQGFGDAIQFIRYLPLAAQRGGNIILECQPELQRLFQTMAPDLPIVARRQALPHFDVYCSLMSLPRVFSTDLSNIPGTAPYLRADAAEAAIWRQRLGGPCSSLKVGLVWAGNPGQKNDRHRSMRLASLAPLADVPAVRFYSLQKGAAAAEASAPPAGLELIDVAEDLQDFADSAALIANLDLVITVDTSVAHLAGAMGKPVWTLLRFLPDWRWLPDRSHSLWYPTMRLFRQPRLTDWASPIADLRAQLHLLVQSPVREV